MMTAGLQLIILVVDKSVGFDMLMPYFLSCINSAKTSHKYIFSNCYRCKMFLYIYSGSIESDSSQDLKVSVC